MKLPRGVSGVQLVRALMRLGYERTRQSGSHVRLTISTPDQHHLTVPLLDPIPVGTLSTILKEAAAQLEKNIDEIIELLR